MIESAGLEGVLGLLVELASGDYAARGIPSGTDEDVAALMVGVNMLAEELEAGRAELEQLVANRTAALVQINDDVVALSDLSNRLQRCATSDEALETLAQGMPTLFSRASGGLYVCTDDADVFVRRTAWGPNPPSQTMLDATGRAAPGSDGATQSELIPTMITNAQPSRSDEADRAAPAVSGSWCVPMTNNGQLFGLIRLLVVEGADADTATSINSMINLAIAAAESAALTLANLDLREGLLAQAMRDPLTGLYNRRFMKEWAAGELSRTDRAGESLGVILLDIDRFKQVNDEHGHEVGDEVLRAVSSILRGALRPEDIACRYGGEEFALLLTFIDADALAARAEELRSLVECAHGQHEGFVLPSVTVSGGYALYRTHGGSLDDALNAADDALYRAKRTGRNRVVAAVAARPPRRSFLNATPAH